jgi:hypothetical protein
VPGGAPDSDAAGAVAKRRRVDSEADAHAAASTTLVVQSADVHVRDPYAAAATPTALALTRARVGVVVSLVPGSLPPARAAAALAGAAALLLPVHVRAVQDAATRGGGARQLQCVSPGGWPALRARLGSLLLPLSPDGGVVVCAGVVVHAGRGGEAGEPDEAAVAAEVAAQLCLHELPPSVVHRHVVLRLNPCPAPRAAPSTSDLVGLPPLGGGAPPPTGPLGLSPSRLEHALRASAAAISAGSPASNAAS